MLILLNIISLTYIIILLKKKYPVSLTMYWIVIFYMIYIFTPMIRNYTLGLSWISDSIVEEIGLYSVIGLFSFIFFNIIFLFKLDALNNRKLNSYSTINFKSVKKLLIFFSAISVILLILTIGTEGINAIFKSGSRALWLGETKKNVFYTFAELSLFYVAILGSIFVLSSKTKIEKKESIIIFSIIIIFTSILVFARRHVIYPIFAIIFYKLSKTKNKRKIIGMGLAVIPIFFIAMFIMGYFRTYGASNTNMQSIINYFKYGNFIDIFFSNTDFSASYYFLSKQVMCGDIHTSPLGYFKVFFALIPRSIWPNKPGYTSVEILSILEPLKVSQGFSAGTGYIGEALATLGVGGLIIVSGFWGILCGYLDKKYYYLREKKNHYLYINDKEFDFTIYEFLYLYTGMLLITESHRGDFGVASIHFVLEIITIAISLKIFTKNNNMKEKSNANTIDKSKETI